MTKLILLAATGQGAEMNACASGLCQKLTEQGLKTVIHRPILQQSHAGTADKTKAKSISATQLQTAIECDNVDELMELAVANIEAVKQTADVVLLLGLLADEITPYANDINQRVAQALSAQVILLADARCSEQGLVRGINYQAAKFAGKDKDDLLGVIVTHADAQGALTVAQVTEATCFNAQLPLLVALPFIADSDGDAAALEQRGTQIAAALKIECLQAYLQGDNATRISPAAFRHGIVQRAIAAQKTIVLPEGDEPRTVAAASICGARGMVKCILLAEPEKVQAVADSQGITLGENVDVQSPTLLREKYWQRLVELRAHKGMTEALAREQLQDNVVLGTMMLEADDVDGLVSGAVHTTANTIRPPLQIIKTAPQTKVVSSVFFMCLPDQVLVYGDCAIIPNPSVDELAQVAIQSHDSARAFGIDPKVAMISYSTGDSGSGADVESVQAATAKVRELRPDILVDGPLQYDAASVESVARKKAPDSEVAGQATVFIFPNLNTGNTTYKAVQRTAGAIAMGPVLQGMRKPVNDLSRGALVDDIVYTIAITAVQAAQNEQGN